MEKGDVKPEKKLVNSCHRVGNPCMEGEHCKSFTPSEYIH